MMLIDWYKPIPRFFRDLIKIYKQLNFQNTGKSKWRMDKKDLKNNCTLVNRVKYFFEK